MKTKMKITTVVLTLVVMLVSACVVVCAEENLDKIVATVENISVEEDSVDVSCALNVIAYQNQMSVAGVSGNVLNFSAERFACAMNISMVDRITITELPSIMNGSLYVGSEGVSAGQTLSAANIELLTYEEAENSAGGNAYFKFTLNDSTYEIVCNVYMLDEINYCPTVSMASYASLNMKTYKDVMVMGVLSAYDPEGDELRYEVAKYPKHGRVEIKDKALGTYTYVPNGSYTGEDSFEYVVRDKFGNYSASAEVSIDIISKSTPTIYSDLLNDAMYPYAISMTENGLMNGVQVGNCYYFEADREVTRADFLITAMNAIGIKNVPDVDCTGFYDDEDISPEMKGYIALAYSKGYISGTKSAGELCFCPNEEIKLSEAAVIISNMIGYAKSEITPVFADSDTIPSWSSRAIESLYTLGILELPDMTVGAGMTVTRGEMAKLLDKTMLVIGK